MKVPFIFEILQYDQENPLYSWIFYRLFQIAKNNNCIIAQENHYQSIDEKKRNYFHENSKLMGYKLPKNEDLKEAKKYQITNGETRKILSKYNSRYEAARTLIVKRDQDFEQILEDKINKIESLTRKKVEVIITWVGLKSLYEVAKKRKIKVIIMELSPIRKPNYNMTLGYFTFKDKYDLNGCKEEYQQFLKEYNLNKVPILNRKELFALCLPTKKINLLKKIEEPEKYDLGFSPGIKQDFFFDNFKKESLADTINKIKNNFFEGKVSVRFHPFFQWNMDIKNWDIDQSSTSLEWILQCRRIVTSVSNVGFEAMLAGKTAYVLSDYMPYSFITINELDYIEDQIVDLKFINFMFFSYFVPWDLMVKDDYINWRLTNPSPLEIYIKHFSYIKKQLQIKGNLTLNNIMQQLHHCNKETIQEYQSYTVSKITSETEKKQTQIEILQKEKELYKNELNKILQSTSWKITSPLRKISATSQNQRRRIRNGKYSRSQ